MMVPVVVEERVPLVLVKPALVYRLHGLDAVDAQLVGADAYDRPMLPMSLMQSAVFPLLEPGP